MNHIDGKSIVITGAGSGFGRLVAQKAAGMGGKITCGDINLVAAEETVSLVRGEGGSANAVRCDVTSMADVRQLVAEAQERHGSVDVMINNAGIMPLAFYADHEQAYEAWDRCIDINFKGVLNGIVAAYDVMMSQGRGQVINLSSIYGNHPTLGGAVYGATKSAVVFLSESLRLEARGKIKVTVVKPTGVPVTGLGQSIVNQQAGAGILGHNMNPFMEMLAQMENGSFPPERLDPDNMDYASLDPQFIADAIVHAMNQPWGVSISEITVRAAGDYFAI